MLPELILKDISDPYAKQNFFRLRKFIGEQVLFDGDFKFFDIEIPSASISFKIAHGLTFTPSDVIQLSAQGNLNFYFIYQLFDSKYIYVFANGPTRIRFLAGKLKDNLRGGAFAAPFPFVAPGDVVGPSSPGFVYGGVGSKTDGFWLTSEGIPTNVCGIPVLFGDGVVTLAAVGSEVESNYTIGIYQHEGSGVNLQLLGSFSVVSGGSKRIDLNLPILYTSTNVQLACRLLTGNTVNLKVSLIVKGTSAI